MNRFNIIFMLAFKIIRWIAIALNIGLWLVIVISLVWHIVDWGIEDVDITVVIWCAAFIIYPLFNIAGLSNILKPLLRLVFTGISFLGNIVIILFLLFMIVWPMGNLGHGWDVVRFWFAFCSIVYTELALAVRIIELLKNAIKEKQF